MSGATGAEIALGLILIRLLLPVGILIGLIIAHVRITIANRTKVNLPADIKANIAGLTHQVSELEETLQRHMAKHAGRQRLAAKAAQEIEDAQTALPGPGAVTPDASMLVPANVWNEADEGQRRVWELSGLQSA